MSADLSAKASSDFMAILLQVANAYRKQKIERPSTVAVVNALLAAEKTAKQRKLIYPFSSLLGQWRLCFATGTRKARERGGILLGKGFYVPKFALTRISFSTTAQALDVTPVKAEIGNSVQLGSFLLKLTGPAQYLGKKNLLTFNSTQMQIRAFGNTIYSGQIRRGKAQELDFYNQSITKLPFFGFFLVTEDFIAARGRGGGLAIWVREI